ncbi:MAG: outer membrane beta-barrel protein, partial [Bacteroidales bacterium]
MKKIILTTVLALGIAFSSNAQNLGYGILLGGNVSGITESPDQLYLGSKFGFQIGGFADYYFSDNVYLKANLMFITKGARNEA